MAQFAKEVCDCHIFVPCARRNAMVQYNGARTGRYLPSHNAHMPHLQALASFVHFGGVFGRVCLVAEIDTSLHIMATPKQWWLKLWLRTLQESLLQGLFRNTNFVIDNKRVSLSLASSLDPSKFPSSRDLAISTPWIEEQQI